MNVHEFLCVHRCFGFLKQEMTAQRRVSFEELAILCHLELAHTSLCMSDIAGYQGALRPTITHRISRLSKLDCVARADNLEDRRNIYCTLTEYGHEVLDVVLNSMFNRIKVWYPETYATKQILCKAIDQAGSLSLSSSELILVALIYEFKKKTATVGALADYLGILQPTASMAVAKLEQLGDVKRGSSTESAQVLSVSITPVGKKRADKIITRIEAISVL